jgi:hypothetical protein
MRKLLIREERDEGLFERARLGPFQELAWGAGGEHPAGVHGHQPVEARGLLHIGGRYEHAHAGPLGADAVDQLPELPP